MNKLLSKLAGGLHKPDGLTTMPFHLASPFLANLPVRVINGVGSKAEAGLGALGIRTCADLRRVKAQALRPVFKKPEVAARIRDCAFGIDNAAVVAKGPPKSVTVEDSFKSLTGFDATRDVLGKVLIPDLLRRMCEDEGAFHRRPKTLTCTFRLIEVRNTARKWSRRSISGPWPSRAPRANAAHHHHHHQQQQHAALTDACVALLRKAGLHDPFTLTLLNVGASKFEAMSNSSRDMALANCMGMGSGLGGEGQGEGEGEGDGGKEGESERERGMVLILKTMNVACT